jgi:hypothetical protein
VADNLSHLLNIQEEGPIEDRFPDEHLFVVNIKTTWLELFYHISHKEKKPLISKSGPFT